MICCGIICFGLGIGKIIRMMLDNIAVLVNTHRSARCNQFVSVSIFCINDSAG